MISMILIKMEDWMGNNGMNLPKILSINKQREMKNNNYELNE